jgi:hypothetical protein
MGSIGYGNLFLTALVAFCLSGCFATQTLRFTNSDVVVTAERSGCLVSDVSVENMSSKSKKVFGNIDVLDANNNTQITFSYSCGMAYPGGKVPCSSYLASDSPSRHLNPTGGLGCPGYSTFHNRMNNF